MSKFSEMAIEKQQEMDEIRRVDFKAKNQKQIDEFNQFMFDQSIKLKVGSWERELFASVYQKFNELFL